MTRGAGSTYYEVRYSARCGTNWVRFPYVARGAKAYAYIRSDWNKGKTFEMSQSGSGGAHWTPMVYAPGNTCIDVLGSWKRNWHSFWENTGSQRIC